MVQCTCWQCHCAVPNSFIVKIQPPLYAPSLSATVCYDRLLAPPPLLDFIPHYPHISFFCIVSSFRCPLSFLFLFCNTQFHRVNMWTTVSLSLHYPSLLPSPCSLPLTVDNSVGQSHQCFGHTVAAGWEKQALIAWMSIIMNNNQQWSNKVVFLWWKMFVLRINADN